MLAALHCPPSFNTIYWNRRNRASTGQETMTWKCFCLQLINNIGEVKGEKVHRYSDVNTEYIKVRGRQDSCARKLFSNLIIKELVQKVAKYNYLTTNFFNVKVQDWLTWNGTSQLASNQALIIKVTINPLQRETLTKSRPWAKNSCIASKHRPDHTWLF